MEIQQSYNSVERIKRDFAGLSAWRTEYLASQLADIEGLKSTSLPLPEESRFTTSLAISNNLPLIAVGSGSYDTNLFFVEAKHERNRETELKIKAFFASRFPIYSLSYQDDFLITGTERGASILYQVSSSQLLQNNQGEGEGNNGGGKGVVKCIETYKNKAAKSVETAAPGNHIASRRVGCVAFCPGTISTDDGGDGSGGAWRVLDRANAKTTTFLSCLSGTVNVWDINRNSKAIRIEKMAGQPIFTAEWSPHNPYSQILSGSTDGGISILDLRKKGRGIFWKMQNDGQGLAINDISWSPFVPYWIASGGDGGVVNIWDIRFTGGNKMGAGVDVAAVIGKNQINGTVTKVCWSKSHLDLINTGSSDRHYRLHNIRIDETMGYTSRVVADRTAADDIGSIVGLVSGSLKDQEVVFSLSDCGDLYTHVMTDRILSNIAIHKKDSEKETKVEADIYTRRLEEGALKALDFVNELLNGNDSKESDQEILKQVLSHSAQIKHLCEIFEEKPELENNLLGRNLSTDSKDTAEEDGAPIAAKSAETEFLRDMRHLSYGLPPGYFSLLGKTGGGQFEKARERLNVTKLRITLQELVAEAKQGEAASVKTWGKLVQQEERVCRGIRLQPRLFDPELLKDLIKIVLARDCIKGLVMGKAFCEIYMEMEKTHGAVVRSQDLAGLVHVLLAPTIFDPDQQQPTQGSTPGSSVSLENLQMTQIREIIRAYLLRNPILVLEMVNLEIKVQEAVLKGGDQVKVADKIITHMKTHASRIRSLVPSRKRPPVKDTSGNADMVDSLDPYYPATVTISAAATRLYLNALIQMRSYDVYLSNVKFWALHHSPLYGLPLTKTLLKQTQEVVAPRFKRQLDVVLSTIEKEPLGLEPRIYRDILMKIATTLVDACVDLYSTLPLSSSSLLDYFSKISNSFYSVLDALVSHSAENKLRASREVSPLINALNDLLSSSNSRSASSPFAIDNNIKSSYIVISDCIKQLSSYS
ncbi:Histone acetyltransferase type B subunit 2 [Zancudomyces culisetae]|uniref:Histone acetyltransferase type B subunit 2 n=1 Tax=Zancudomyces culisetae TaxID=1213189 RepID=A0A1R1PUU0_ZANCU|nr:Histone acetyltransferase type B subunit 2 [Zancudomyces culisetae]|eukprot:OMH84734.1 Histone acetyltransferase type B subunit 2 [Zancudomyces culisetae]